jgi:hypothetical protein
MVCNIISDWNLSEIKPQAFHITSNAQIYHCKGGYQVYKMVYCGGQRELDLMLVAGDFSVHLLERAIGPIYGDGDGMTGYTMKRETPLDIKLVDPS